MQQRDIDRFARRFRGFMRTNPSYEQIEELAKRLDADFPETAAKVRRVAMHALDRRLAVEVKGVTKKKKKKRRKVAAQKPAQPAQPHVEQETEQVVAGRAQRAVGQPGPAFTFTAADVATHGAEQAPVSRSLVGPESVAKLREALDKESIKTSIAGAQVIQAGMQRRDQHDSLTLEGAVYDTDVKRTRAQKERVGLEAAKRDLDGSAYKNWLEEMKVENERRRIELEHKRIAEARNAKLVSAGMTIAGGALLAYFASKKG